MDPVTFFKTRLLVFLVSIFWHIWTEYWLFNLKKNHHNPLKGQRGIWGLRFSETKQCDEWTSHGGNKGQSSLVLVPAQSALSAPLVSAEGINHGRSRACLHPSLLSHCIQPDLLHFSNTFSKKLKKTVQKKVRCIKKDKIVCRKFRNFRWNLTF